MKNYGLKWAGSILRTGYLDAGCSGWKGNTSGAITLMTAAAQGRDLSKPQLDAALTLTSYANAYAKKNGHKLVKYPKTFTARAVRLGSGRKATAQDYRQARVDALELTLQ